MTTGIIDVNLVVDDVSGEGLQRGADEIARLGLSRAWVTPRAACTSNPEPFDALAGVLEALPTLQLVPVLIPPTGEPGAFTRAIQIAGSASCRAVRLCPVGHGYPLVDWVLSPLPELSARERLALVLDFGAEAVPWRDVVALGRANPAVPLVALSGRLGADRTIPAVLDATANVVVELSGLDDIDLLPGFVDGFGSHRFVWGSAGSRLAMRLARTLTDELDDDARFAVLSDNARALADGTYAKDFL